MKASNRAGQLPESLRNSLLHGPFAKILCAAALVGIAPLPGYAQTAPPPNPLPAHLVFPPPDPGLVDGYVPVITMEQIADPLGILQGYRIQIFKDGRAYYHGLKEVKRLGEVRFRITPEQVQRIQSKFAKNSFWQVPSDQFSSIKGAPFEGGEACVSRFATAARQSTS